MGNPPEHQYHAKPGMLPTFSVYLYYYSLTDIIHIATENVYSLLLTNALHIFILPMLQENNQVTLRSILTLSP